MVGVSNYYEMRAEYDGVIEELVVNGNPNADEGQDTDAVRNAVKMIISRALYDDRWKKGKIVLYRNGEEYMVMEERGA